MSAKKTPLEQVKEQGGKAKLVDKVAGLIDRDDEEDKDSVKARLLKVSNKKLLRLAEVGKKVKDEFGGSKDKLVARVAQLYGRAKDKDYVARLARYTPAKLLDLANSLAKKAAKK